jgi:uncharacterized membrane protein YfcA
LEEIVVGLVAGLLGGTLGGFLGVGGGVIYVPAMVLLLGEEQQLAQGVSLAVIIATAVVGAATHLRQGNVDLRTVVWVAPAAAAAGFGAALLADIIDASVLRRIFAVVVLYVGATMILSTLRRATVREERSA